MSLVPAVLPVTQDPNNPNSLVRSTPICNPDGSNIGNGSSPANPNASPAAVVAGQIALTAAQRGQLGSNALVNGVIVKSSPNNTANVLVGGSGVTSTADGTGNGYILAPGEAASFAVTNTNAIYAICTAAAILSFEGS